MRPPAFLHLFFCIHCIPVPCLEGLLELAGDESSPPDDWSDALHTQALAGNGLYRSRMYQNYVGYSRVLDSHMAQKDSNAERML